MKVKTSELTGPALDWAVAKAEGHEADLTYYASTRQVVTHNPNGTSRAHRYSTDWAQGGPIIDLEHIDLYYSTKDKTWAAAIWKDVPGGGQLEYTQVRCPTALIAAMRCYVTSKLGDEVEIPEELS